jgi:hypothetical protein
MKHLVLTFALLFVLPAIIAAAAEVSGVWQAWMPGCAGAPSRLAIFKFTSNGRKLNGIITGLQDHEVAISDGKVCGECVSFAVNTEFDGNPMRLLYLGRISGGGMRMLMQPEGAANAGEFTARKIS